MGKHLGPLCEDRFCVWSHTKGLLLLFTWGGVLFPSQGCSGNLAVPENKLESASCKPPNPTVSPVYSAGGCFDITSLGLEALQGHGVPLANSDKRPMPELQIIWEHLTQSF